MAPASLSTSRPRPSLRHFRFRPTHPLRPRPFPFPKMAAPETAEAGEEGAVDAAHAEVLQLWQAGLARLVRDPLLCDLPAQVTPEEIGSQVALEYGQAMTVRVRRADAPEAPMPVVVVQNASVLDLKKAIQRFVQLKQERTGGIEHISWKYVWRTYCLTFGAEKLTDDRKKLREYGIRNRDEVSFVKKLRK